MACPQGKVLNRVGYHRRNASYQYVARQKDCQACPVKGERLPPQQKRRCLGLTIRYPLHLEAQERNQTPAHRREMARRRTIVEGIFASLDRLGWAKSRLRGLWKVDCGRFMASIAHNVLKAVRRLGSGTGPPEPDVSGGYAQCQQPASSGERCPGAPVPAW